MSDTELITPPADRLSLYIFYVHYYSSGYCEEIWVHFLEGRQPKTAKPEINWEKELIARSEKNSGDLSQSGVLPNSKIGEVLS